MQKFRRGKPAFTLIELLIVVAIIAILAAIAVPNMLEAQIRSKVARAKADMRTLAGALEQYHVDHNGYPDIFTRLMVVTTPIQYISQVPRDVFRLQQQTGRGFNRQRTYRYGAMPLDRPSRYIIASVGPDTDIDTYMNTTGDTDDTDDWDADSQALRLYPGFSMQLFSNEGVQVNNAWFRYVLYDATNGTISDGDLYRPGDVHIPQ
jgi:prepilin-type N-terminal cleavage/methylation domain-containing protein